MSEAPGYWMYETSGVLKPAIMAYLDGGPLSPEHIGALRDYFRQWIAAPTFRGPEIEWLREAIDHLNSRRSIAYWLGKAVDAGADPL